MRFGETNRKLSHRMNTLIHKQTEMICIIYNIYKSHTNYIIISYRKRTTMSTNNLTNNRPIIDTHYNSHLRLAIINEAPDIFDDCRSSFVAFSPTFDCPFPGWTVEIFSMLVAYMNMTIDVINSNGIGNNKCFEQYDKHFINFKKSSLFFSRK